MPKRAADDAGPQLYCHCRKPTGAKNETMVACEICDNWFHLPCVGLRRTASLPKNFMCRDCVAEGFIGSAGGDWFMEGAAEPEPTKRRKVAKADVAAAKKEKKKPAKAQPKGDAAIRSKVRSKLAEALSGTGDAAVADSAESEAAAERVEEALLQCFGGTGTDYKTKARDLAFNLADALNSSLRLSVVRGETPAGDLVRMSNTELANEQKKIEAWKIEAEKLRLSQKHHSKLDQSTMDKDGTVHWTEAPADEVAAPAAATTAAGPAVGPAAAAPAAAVAPRPAAAAAAAPAAAAPAGAAVDLRTQEQRLIDQIAALPADVVAQLPPARRAQFEAILRQAQQPSD